MTALDRFWPRFVAKVKFACSVLFNGNVYIGNSTEHPACPTFLLQMENIPTADDDFLWSGSGGLMIRKLLIRDKGDACDLGMGRVGPDGSKLTDMKSAATEPNSRIGSLYWQSWGGTVDPKVPLFWTPRDGHNAWLGEVACRASGAQTATSRGGRFQIKVCPEGKTDAVDRLEINGKGELLYNFPGKGMKKITVDANGFLKAK